MYLFNKYELMSNHDAEVLMTPFHTYTIPGQPMYNMHVWLFPWSWTGWFAVVLVVINYCTFRRENLADVTTNLMCQHAHINYKQQYTLH